MKKKRREGEVIADENPEILDTLHNMKSKAERMINSDDMVELRELARDFRRVLSIEKNPPIDEVIASGVVPRLVDCLSSGDPPLQFEASWAVTNVASGRSDHTRYIVECDVVPPLIYLLKTASDDVKEQCVWALGNIAGDNVDYRNMVLDSGALEPICRILMTATETAFIRNATWALSNLCRGRPQPQWEKVRDALPALTRLLYNPEEDILIDACWALSYLSDGTGDRVAAIIEAGLVRRLVSLLMHPHPSVQTPSLRTVGNIVTGTDEQTQQVIALGALNSLCALLAHPKRNVRKEACWTISNITAGHEEQIQAVIDAGIMEPLIQLLNYSPDFAIRKEACWAVSNATTGGTPEQIDLLVELGCIPPLCEFLKAPDLRLIMVALEGIENILDAGNELAQETGTYNKYVDMVEECKGLESIVGLQSHKHSQIYDKACSIVEEYFTGGNVDEDSAPQVADGRATFGSTRSGGFGGGWK